MKLVSAHLQKFRNFDDSGEVPIQPDVTALVGKNESGKTAFLQGLHRLNPIDGKKFDELDHYPRWMYTRDRKGGSIPSVTPVQAVFEMEASDRAALGARFGPDVVVASKVTVGRRYDDVVTVGQDVQPDEAKAVANLVARSQVPQHLAERFVDLKTFQALESVLAELERPPAEGSAADPAIAPAVASIRAQVQALDIGDDFQSAVRSALRVRVPQFFYFSDYDFIGGRTDLRRVYSTPPDQLDPPERTALSLLRLAGADNAAMLNEDYESRKAELEAVSNELTGEMTEYWSQSKDLEVVIDVDKETEQQPNGPTAVARHLEVRVKDRRHGHTDNIDKRSNGFRWFFSFLAAFSEYEGRDDRIIILLDEPALTLHARAQKDFLRFIDDRLAPKHQVVYSTHSPFMVESGRLERARLVEDKGAKVGSKVTSDVLSTDRDTLFPLQAALGYDIAQNLFIAPHNLLLEGTSDYTYLQVLSEHLASLGREGLDDRWSLLPVGSVTKITTFLALLGQHLDVTVLVDAGSENKAVSALVRNGKLAGDRFITPAQVTGGGEADIEDLFTIDEYLELYNTALGGTPLQEDDLVGDDRILKRIERARQAFHHGLPADYLLRHRDEFLGKVTPETLDRFEDLFQRINATLPNANS